MSKKFVKKKVVVIMFKKEGNCMVIVSIKVCLVVSVI